MFEGIVYVLRTGCQWKALPKERFGSPSSIHGYFTRWIKAGFFLSLWRAGLAEYDEMEGISWQWQSIDGAMIKAPMALEEVGRNPTDRGEKGSKRHILVDEHGVPLSLVVIGANRHDVSKLERVLDQLVVLPPKEIKQNLCADKGYTGNTAKQVIEAHGYVPHVKERGEEIKAKKEIPGYRSRRWVVELTHSRLNRFRKVFVKGGNFETNDKAKSQQ